MTQEAPRAPGVWVPFAAFGFIFAFITFAGAYIGTIRVIERDLAGIEQHLGRLDRVEEEAVTDRREFAVRLGRLEAAIGGDRRGHP